MGPANGRALAACAGCHEPRGVTGVVAPEILGDGRYAAKVEPMPVARSVDTARAAARTGTYSCVALGRCLSWESSGVRAGGDGDSASLRSAHVSSRAPGEAGT